MKRALCRLLIAAACTACAWTSEPIESTLASGRKALLNDGVPTAWKLSQKALGEAPESAAAHEFAGEVLFRRGQFSQAESEFKHSTKLDPNFARAWWGLAKIAACESMDKTADRYFQRAHELAPTDSRIFLDWAMRLKGAEHIDALETYASLTDPNREQQEVEGIRQHIRLDKSLRGRKIGALVSPYEKAEIPLLPLVTSTRSRTYGLEVDINGRKLKLVLDTGAGGFVVQRSAAEKAGVQHLLDVNLHGFGDNAKLRSAYTGIAARVGIGGVTFQDALISVSNQEFVDIEDGLIGTNVFSQFLVTIDFSGKKLLLNPLPGYRPDSEESLDATVPADLQGWTRFYQFGHMLLIPTRVGGSREALFVIDTGAARTLISYDMAAEVSKLDRNDTMGLRGINGRVSDVYQAGDLYLQFAGFRQRNQAMTSFDMWPQSRGIGVEISGFLGLPVLSLFNITIDYRDGLVKFDYKGP